MYLLYIDPVCNLLHIRLAGEFDEQQADELCAEFGRRLPELREGFLVFSDLTGLEKFGHSARKHYRIFMDLCRQNGLGKVIRIVPGSLNNFGLTIMSHFHHQHVRVITCENIEEAHRHLRAAGISKGKPPMDHTENPIETLKKAARQGMHRRLAHCPVGGNPAECPLHEIRKQPMPQREAWLASKTDDEVIALYRQHIPCLEHVMSQASLSPDEDMRSHKK
ncbi:hypothetical protein [Pontiella sp.]|uniref:hypothetical protein n=1 Tax=Pontiella sp. TaxID=2837462 RepID=UPI003566A360